MTKAERQKKARMTYPEAEMYSAAKIRARKKNILFSIEAIDVKIPDICPALGTPLIVGSASIETSPTLDRLDPIKGYVPENVRVISKRANMIKSDASVEELRKVVEWLKVVTAVKIL